MSLSASKVIGLLLVFALMLARVSCQIDESETSRAEVRRKECVRQVAEKMAHYSMPGGLEELVAHVNGLYSGSMADLEAKYVPIAQPADACVKLDEIFEEISDHAKYRLRCFREYKDIYMLEDEYTKLDISIKPLLDARRACEINRKYLLIECVEELDADLANYKYPEEASKLVDCVNSTTYEFIARNGCRRFVKAKFCVKVEEKYEVTIDNMHCSAAKAMPTIVKTIFWDKDYPLRHIIKGKAIELLYKSAIACNMPWWNPRGSYSNYPDTYFNYYKLSYNDKREL